jgi:hypothetical protein
VARNCKVASEAAIITAYRHGIAVSAIARRTGKPLGAIEWTLKKAGLKRNDHKRPGVAEAGDATPEDQSAAFRRQDLAFCRAMARAIASGRETPPLIGVHKDTRRLDVRKLLEPVAHSSGCTSPAQECADLGSPDDGRALADDNQPPPVRHQ